MKRDNLALSNRQTKPAKSKYQHLLTRAHYCQICNLPIEQGVIAFLIE